MAMLNNQRVYILIYIYIIYIYIIQSKNIHKQQALALRPPAILDP